MLTFSYIQQLQSGGGGEGVSESSDCDKELQSRVRERFQAISMSNSRTRAGEFCLTHAPRAAFQRHTSYHDE